MKENNLISAMTENEMTDTRGGLIGAIAAIYIGYLAIGAKICWEMGVDNRQ